MWYNYLAAVVGGVIGAAVALYFLMRRIGINRRKRYIKEHHPQMYDLLFGEEEELH